MVSIKCTSINVYLYPFIKDFPCPVLLRELMVWCWQENPDDRPKGNDIIEKCSTLHFPKLLDGIRVCDAGQVSLCAALMLYIVFVV